MLVAIRSRKNALSESGALTPLDPTRYVAACPRQAATYLVGSNGVNAPLSESAFLRDRIATNIGIASDQELNNLTFNQNVVVTFPGNTRFYIVVEKGTTVREERARPATTQQVINAPLPTAEELRQLMQLRQELSEMYQQSGTQSTAQQVPQQ